MVTKVAKTRPRTEAHDEKRALIIEGCATLFDKVGYHNTSMQMVADEVGLGKPTLYHYFPSKIAILYAIHDTHITSLLRSLESLKGKDPAVVLQAACADILRQIATHPGYVRAFMDNYHDLEGEMKDSIRTARRTYFNMIKDVIIEGTEKGQFRETDPLLTAYAFLGMGNWAYKWYPAMAAERTPEEVALALCTPFLDGLKAK
ncbi:MAG: TetR family transcriptional regulator [Blastomonas sp. CACIA14H2]|jgi:AcrR family transcriptional regulator|uniref:TetR/AcrR family transcriptional regulator n=1 Tax=Blastomonas sp. CACIA14H2 TaxID=1419876 RepID=UPI0003D0530A|nr:MAG: TetR family transcriptional regulator [Blastomonas sp. CACIA14H2]